MDIALHFGCRGLVSLQWLGYGSTKWRAPQCGRFLTKHFAYGSAPHPCLRGASDGGQKERVAARRRQMPRGIFTPDPSSHVSNVPSSPVHGKDARTSRTYALPSGHAMNSHGRAVRLAPFRFPSLFAFYFLPSYHRLSLRTVTDCRYIPNSTAAAPPPSRPRRWRVTAADDQPPRLRTPKAFAPPDSQRPCPSAAPSAASDTPPAPQLSAPAQQHHPAPCDPPRNRLPWRQARSSGCP